MTEFNKVWAVHKLTGILSQVLPSEIENIDALELATEKQIKAAIAREETEVYGAPIKDGVIPEGPSASDAKDVETNKGGTDNG